MPIPKAESLVAFMQFHGWEIDKKTEFHYVMKPPTSIKPASFRTKIPFHYGGHGSGFDTAMFALTESAANLYDWNHWELLHFLTKNKVKEIEALLKEGVETKRQLASAS